MKIGTLADWFGVGLVEGIKKSAECGADGVQIYAWKDFNPLNLDRALADEVRDTAKAYGQEIIALCGELGGHGFENAGERADKIKYIKAVVDLGDSMNCHIVTTHIGVIPSDTTSPRYVTMRDACREAGEYAASRGSKIAIETGPEPIERLRRFVDDCAAPGVGINYDPGNLVMVTGVDEVEGVRTAGDAIVHTHAKDGVMHKFFGVEEAYAIFADGGIEEMQKLSDYFEERPLGQGSVRWKEYLAALREVGYDGYLTIEREVKDKADEIAGAVNFLRGML
ncbi:MAG: sugar phosphate isomerase/epimerase [Synergistaceae bacterium]|jgi:sugar phosphate isomerase/epimerase|nr:sugar phosphate isomerase/epimerase [Synergistaceae bacterium]